MDIVQDRRPEISEGLSTISTNLLDLSPVTNSLYSTPEPPLSGDASAAEVSASDWAHVEQFLVAESFAAVKKDMTGDDSRGPMTPAFGDVSGGMSLSAKAVDDVSESNTIQSDRVTQSVELNVEDEFQESAAAATDTSERRRLPSFRKTGMS